MSRTIRKPLTPAFSLAIIAATALARPENMLAQTGERALLNEVPAVNFVAIGSPNSPIGNGPFFTLRSRGAIKLAVSGDDARYGMITTVPGQPTLVVISLGATTAEGSLTLTIAASELVPNGRHAVGRKVKAFVAAGRPERPLGAFHGEAGWVTITAVENGRIAGEFELLARGFLATDPHDENRWVAVLGGFEARGGSTILASAGVKHRSPS
jgi:hypothetical protein